LKSVHHYTKAGARSTSQLEPKNIQNNNKTFTRETLKRHNMNVTAKAGWKSVAIDPQLRARGFAEGLLGIEELSDYQLVKVNKKKKAVAVIKPAGKVTNVTSSSKIKVKGQKRPIEAATPEIEEEEPEVKKKKKSRQKRKPKIVKPAEEISLEEVPTVDEEVEEDVLLEGWMGLSIPQPVLRALKESGFTEPTPIQRETLPAAINGHSDVLGAAETGSGKTLAFAIPIIYGILADRENEQNLPPVQDEQVRF
jgi:ATP-dependent RNA helicase DDX24/MAK5